MQVQTTKETASPGFRSRVASIADLARTAFWLVLVVAFLLQAYGPSSLAAKRTRVLDRIGQERHSRVIAMIHRQDTASLFGVPVSKSIGIEDSEAVLRAIRLTPPDQPIDFILHTPGGLVLATEQIAHALVEHRGKVTVFVPHYAMSGGTMLALTASELVMDPNAVLGPVDPQIGPLPAASIVKLLELKRPAQVTDGMLVLADVAQKARGQVTAFLEEVLSKRLPKDRAAALAATLSEGRWTHDYPITVEVARQLGLSVSTDMPAAIYELMDLYPQAGAGRPSVMYVPVPRPSAAGGQQSDPAESAPARNGGEAVPPR